MRLRYFKKQFCLVSLIIYVGFIICLLSSMNPVHAKELQVGVSPLMLDLGTVKKGESVVGSFFIVTSSQDEIIVKLKSSRSNFDFFKRPTNADIINSVSEEDSSGWVYFPENPYVLKAVDDTLNTKSGTISDWKNVNFVLNVPEDAESCYHAFKIEPTPYTTKEEGSSVSIVAMVAITVKFQVDGECAVEGNILDIMQDTSSDYVDLGVYFKNIGTVTFSAQSPEVIIIYENGTLRDKQRSGSVSITPGDIGVLNARFDPKKIVPGNYLVNSTVIYGGNTTSKQVSLTIEKPEVVKASAVVSKTSDGVNNARWILLFLIIMIMVGAYKFYKAEDRR